jgi:hypothetical protein
MPGMPCNATELVHFRKRIGVKGSSNWEKSSEWKRFDWVDIGLDLVNIFFKQNDQEIRGILAKVGWFVYGYC